MSIPAPPSGHTEPDPHAPAAYRFTDSAYVPLADKLSELRTRIDVLDEQIVALLAQRAACAKDAARFKSSLAQVRAQARQQQVIDHVRELATQHNPGLDGFEDVVEQTYRTLVSGLVDAQGRLHPKLIPI